MTAPMPGRELQQGFEPAVFSIFRRIRGELMSERRFGSYLRYAIGDLEADTKMMVPVDAQIRDIIRPRVEVELPRLRRMAADITKLIRSEYP